MFCRIHSGAVYGIEGMIIEVEVDISNGLPSLNMVGMLSAEVKESAERVRTALKNSEYEILPKRITVNLSPAAIRKQGALYDLPIAVGILTDLGYIAKENLENVLIVGELSLNGIVKPVNGILPILCAAKNEGIQYCLVPSENENEGAIIEGICVFGVHSLKEVLTILKDIKKKCPNEGKIRNYNNEEEKIYDVDFSEVNGQETLKRAVQIAAAGMHNFLMIGPPGSGKTMIARRIPTILPPMTIEECIEVTKIYSVAGKLSEKNPLITQRPFRAPHHTISSNSLVGGGKIPKPGEISMSNFGVLFLDELLEFPKSVLEVLRQPMEDRKVFVSRVYGSFEFPTNFMLVAAMNPCSCGYYPDKTRCRCKEKDVQKYLGKISRPLLDRIDICVEAPQVDYEEIRYKTKREKREALQSREEKRETSAVMRERVVRAREIQKARYKEEAIFTNSELSVSQIEKYCQLDEDGERLLEQAFQRLGLTARGYNRVLKVARTIADIEGEEQIRKNHLSEAIYYRSTDLTYWKR